ncbi:MULTISPECIES: M16 family metallopeptidase [unclassified Campylobacter]|uniref:M16 family metallopeptidase n=1 Tax=unclassified Campylobacter TaxID=2593542 RepID=UPI0012381243|nr:MULTISPECIES: pitrilysin family protein [unclassified Campylobacter]KAA6226631.1 insulinase family protein [Campylobacter sp. LR286c]KAA6227561.1 insulinase family protein [Campylobacter sp. LR185c]KAA6230001.1 insulinase family protein [Campylobacter sp. LR291e]KAA8603312.1 peptidase M16 [Campylobacter sp. LR185c]
MQYLEEKKVKIPLIFEENNDLDIVVCKFVFKNCGRSYDKIDGLCKMFANLLNEGVDDKFFKELDFRAISLEASSGFESLELSLSMLKEQAKFGFLALKELLQKPRFDEEILKRIKINTLGNLASKNSDFDYLAKRLLDKSIFEYEEFKTSNSGDEKSIENINLTHLKAFYDDFISLSNLCIVLGGKLDIKEAKTLLGPILSILKKGIISQDKHYELSKKTKNEMLIRKESEQAYIYFSSPIFIKDSDKDAYLAKIALFILGQGGFGSRLMEEIRVKRGLAYSAYAMLDLRTSFQRVFGYLQTKNKSAKEAKNIVKEVFANFIKNGVNEDELNGAKNFLIGSTPLRYESLIKRLNIAFSEYYKGLGIGHYKKELDFIEKTKLNELNAYIKRHKEILNLSFASVQNEA